MGDCPVSEASPHIANIGRLVEDMGDSPVSEASPHIANIGRLVEDMENKIRNTLNEIYFGKTRDIVNGLRSVEPLSEQHSQEALKNDLVRAMMAKCGAKE